MSCIRIGSNERIIIMKKRWRTKEEKKRKKMALVVTMIGACAVDLEYDSVRVGRQGEKKGWPPEEGGREEKIY